VVEHHEVQVVLVAVSLGEQHDHVQEAHGGRRADTPDDPDELAVAAALVGRAGHTPS
jgi:hypothetical protein